jgi:hypothetical protein
MQAATAVMDRAEVRANLGEVSQQWQILRLAMAAADYTSFCGSRSGKRPRVRVYPMKQREMALYRKFCHRQVIPGPRAV